MIIDFHVHSSFSFDSKSNVREIIKRCKKINLDGVAITDHNTIKGGLKALSLKEENFFVIVGSEIQTDKGEVIGLFLDEEIKSRNFYDVIEKIKNQGGISVLSHPFRYAKNILNGIEKDVIRNVDAVEKINYSDHPLALMLSVSLAKKIRKPLLGSSDAHSLENIGKVKTVIYDAEDLESIRKSILKKKTKILFNSNLYFKSIQNLFEMIGEKV